MKAPEETPDTVTDEIANEGSGGAVRGVVVEAARGAVAPAKFNDRRIARNKVMAQIWDREQRLSTPPPVRPLRQSSEPANPATRAMIS